MIDIRQTQHYANYLKSLGWIVERIDKTNYFVKKLPLLGSVLKIQRPDEIRFKVIAKLAKKYRAFQIIVEPKSDNAAKLLIRNGYKLSKNPYLPTKTLHLDLTKTLKFEKETRRSIRIGDRTVIRKYSTSTEIKTFREAWKKSVNFKRYVPGSTQLINLRKYFPNSYSLFLASHNVSGSIIGGVIFTRTSHGVAYYWQAFTNKEGRSSLSQYSLLHQGILWAKKQGCKIFDFEGIFDPRFPNKSWLGFTHFKKSFGGTEVLYPSCYTKSKFSLI